MGHFLYRRVIYSEIVILGVHLLHIKHRKRSYPHMYKMNYQLRSPYVNKLRFMKEWCIVSKFCQYSIFSIYLPEFYNVVVFMKNDNVQKNTYNKVRCLLIIRNMETDMARFLESIVYNFSPTKIRPFGWTDISERQLSLSFPYCIIVSGTYTISQNCHPRCFVVALIAVIVFSVTHLTRWGRATQILI